MNLMECSLEFGQHTHMKFLVFIYPPRGDLQYSVVITGCWG